VAGGVAGIMASAASKIISAAWQQWAWRICNGTRQNGGENKLINNVMVAATSWWRRQLAAIKRTKALMAKYQ